MQWIIALKENVYYVLYVPTQGFHCICHAEGDSPEDVARFLRIAKDLDYTPKTVIPSLNGVVDFPAMLSFFGLDSYYAVLCRKLDVHEAIKLIDRLSRTGIYGIREIDGTYERKDYVILN